MHLDEQIQQHIGSLPISLKAEVLDFVLFLEQKQAKQDFGFSQDQSIIKLSKQQQEKFVDSLLNPKPLNDKLKRSAQAYKEKMGL